ncbi:MAG TPA: cell division protein ZapA, partial [Chromatiales bacterium]|nr:cell division protein ZapA [Chromatiales bacterium]
MSEEPVLVTVRILDREYRVACPPGEREDLMASARHLDQLMREIRDSGKVIGLDRIAVMAALNMAHELLEL